MNIRVNENIPRYEAKNIWKIREEEQERIRKQNHANMIQILPNQVDEYNQWYIRHRGNNIPIFPDPSFNFSSDQNVRTGYYPVSSNMSSNFPNSQMSVQRVHNDINRNNLKSRTNDNIPPAIPQQRKTRAGPRDPAGHLRSTGGPDPQGSGGAQKGSVGHGIPLEHRRKSGYTDTMGAWGEEPMPGSSAIKKHNPAGSSRPDEHNWKPENTGPRDAHQGDIGYGNPGRHRQWSGYTEPGDALQEGPIPGSAKKPLPSQRPNKENSPQHQNQVQDANYNQNNNSSPNNENPIISFLKKNCSQIYSIILEIISLFNSNEDHNTKTNSIFKIINQIMLMFTSASQNDPQPPNNQPNNSGKTYANQTNPHQIPPLQ